MDAESDGTGGFALWGSRFERGLSPEAEALNRSLPMDVRLWREELELVAAWVDALAAAGVVSGDAAKRLTLGVDRVGERLAAGAADGAADEDIHTLVERLLAEEVGELAGALRTGRSRNDAAATATRLWVMRAAQTLRDDLARVGAALLSQAEASVDVVAPSYTHLQRAQPIRLAHFFLSHFWPLERDRERFERVKTLASVMPLGAGAIAGSGFPIDREALKERLGFSEIAPNSIDAVSDRDFVAEFAFAAALAGAHLSRTAEDLILFSSTEFGFIRFADTHSTGSSLMPHKRNPDVAELVRGKSARLVGEVAAALTLLKSLPSGYNKDLQEDKAILFDAYDNLRISLPAFAGAVETLQVDSEAAGRALEPAMLAVDVADALVRKGVTFHEAHAAVGALVRQAEKKGVGILEMKGDDVAALHSALPATLEAVAAGGGLQPYERSLEARALSGGTARDAVLAQIDAARAALT